MANPKTEKINERLKSYMNKINRDRNKVRELTFEQMPKVLGAPGSWDISKDIPCRKRITMPKMTSMGSSKMMWVYGTDPETVPLYF